MNIPIEILKESKILFGISSTMFELGGMEGKAFAYNVDGRELVLKITPKNKNVDNEIKSLEEKISFIKYLRENDVCVPEPVRSVNNRWVERSEKDDKTYLISSSSKAEGLHVHSNNPSQWNDKLFENWGRTLGKMHRYATQYTIYDKFSQNGEEISSIASWREEYQFFYDWCSEIPIKDKWEELYEKLYQLPIEKESYGLIHNDLHPHNFLVHNNKITAIDFDVAAFYWFVKDIAIALFFAEWYGPADKKSSKDIFLEDFYIDFMKGYTAEYHINRFWVSQLPLFLKHHQILLYIVFSNEWGEKPGVWQTEQLKYWRDSILNERAVLHIDF